MITSIITYLSISSLTFVAAQTPTSITSGALSPIPATCAAYATVDEKALYVQGGFTNLTGGASLQTDQFYALNLSHNWTSSNPPWTALTDIDGRRPPLSWGNSMAVSKSKESLIMWATQGYDSVDSGLLSFSIAAKSWAAITEPLPVEHTTWYKLKSVVDPDTGLVYIPSGWNNGTSMAIYNPEGSSFTSVPMPSFEIMTPTVGYSTAVWSTQRKSILIYGGLNYLNVHVGNPYLIEYVPGGTGWRRLKTTGESPGDISGHCMVPGEYVAARIELFGTPLIYNLRTDQWTTEFILNSTTSPPELPPKLPSKSINVVAIASGCAAIAVTILVAFLIYRRRKYKQLARQSSDLSLVDPGSDAATKFGSSNLVALYSPSTTVGSPHAFTSKCGTPHTPTTTTGYQYSPSVTSSFQHSSSPSAGNGYFPFTASGYIPPPRSSDVGSLISPNGSDPWGGNGHQGYGKAEYNDDGLPMQSGVRGSPQAYVPDSHNNDTLNDTQEQGLVGTRKQNPQYHPTPFQPWGLSQTNRPEYRSSVYTSSDIGLEQQLELLRTQQEQQYQLQQQNLERLMLEHQKQLQQLHEQLRTKP
ncbi:hypothetical protein BGZ72_005877 [Mortierella alpina]|nr:hypothetical protein BGZ72_005877 [Mortierella alpina]